MTSATAPRKTPAKTPVMANKLASIAREVKRQRIAAEKAALELLAEDGPVEMPPVPAPVPLWHPFPKHPGLTIPKDWQDPSFNGKSDWSHYPVLQVHVEPQLEFIADMRHLVEITTAQQDGIWVAGYNWTCASGGGGHAPGRKFGEFASELRARYYAVWQVEQALKDYARRHADEKVTAKATARLLAVVSAGVQELREECEAERAADPAVLRHQVALLMERWKRKAANVIRLTPRLRGEIKAVLCEAQSKVLQLHSLQGKPVADELERQVLKEYGVPLYENTRREWTDDELLGRAKAAPAKPPVHTAATRTNQKIGPKLKRKLGHQAGAVLEDGTMVVDPTKALEELHDQVNGTPAKPAPVPEGKTIDQLTGKITAPLTIAEALASLPSAGYRGNEVRKDRFTSIVRKLATWPPEERAALLRYLNTQ